MPTRLSTLSRGRDNHLNLLRVIAASMVLVSHSFVLVSGNPASEPWHDLIGRSPGGVAVDVFFIISGFLVTGSLQRQGSISGYLAARALRIYPGLWVALLLTVLAVGLMGLSTLSTPAFFADGQTWRFLARNAVMVAGGEGLLPGAFLGNPLPGAVNGSLWTLRYELRLYLLLALVWWGAGLLARQLPGWRIESVLTGLASLFTLLAVGMMWTPWSSDFVRMAGMFFAGATLWAWRQQISLRGEVVLASGAAMTVALALSPQLFELAYRLGLPYGVMWLAYRCRGGGGLAAPVQPGG